LVRTYIILSSFDVFWVIAQCAFGVARCPPSFSMFYVINFQSFLDIPWSFLDVDWHFWSVFFLRCSKYFKIFSRLLNVLWCLLDVPWHLFDATQRENPDISNAFPMLHDTLVISPVFPNALQHLPNTLQYPCFLLTSVWHSPHHLENKSKGPWLFFYSARHLVPSSWCCPMSPSVSLALFNTHVMP
jgi:hypothetical protein